jgi:hypothetical protein
MRADPSGTHTEQKRAQGGWMNATTRRKRIRAGEDIPLGRTCATCSAWTGNLIDNRAYCDTIGCSTHVAALCSRWRPFCTSIVWRPHPVRPEVEQ